LRLKTKVADAAIVTLLMLSVLSSSFRVQIVRAAPGTIRVPTDYSTIQAAVNAANPGDTIYVRNGIYNEGVTLNKTVWLVGESESLTIVNGSGVVFFVSQNNVNITGFTIIEASGDTSSVAMYLHSVNNCNVKGNNITTRYGGIEIYNCSSNSLTENSLTSVGGNYGLWFMSSGLNKILGNTLSGFGTGVDLVSPSGNNTFYHNNFMGNTQQVFTDTKDFWDNGYPSGGNYWSDYHGTDVKHGPNQDQAGSDGIGDINYTININNRDNYPLMKPWETGSTQYPWPMFHSNLCHTGYSESPAPSSNQRLWNYTTGSSVESSPAVAGGRVYVGSDDNRVYCLDALTGAFVWSYATGGSVFSSPAVADGKVYVGSEDHRVYCLDALTGAFVWSYATGGLVDSSPIVVGGRVYVGSYDHRVYCLDALNGSLLWYYGTGSLVYSSPAVADGKVYVGSTDNHVYCLDALTGVLIWNYTASSYVYSSPAVADGKVYVGSYDGRVYCLDALTGAFVWSNMTASSVVSSPAVAGGKVYVGSADYRVHCLDAMTGASIWNYTTGYFVSSSPAVADGKVYVGSYDGRVYCLDALTGASIWNYTIGNYVFSSPAVADGVVFIGSDNSTVYAFGNVVRVPEDFKTVQGAVDAAAPGSTVLVAPGVYHEHLVINKTLTLLSRRGSQATFDGGGSGIAILLSGASGITIAGFVIRNYTQGISIVNAANCKIYGTSMSFINQSGVVVQGSSSTGNNIWGNTFQNTGVAINLTVSSSGSVIYENIISSGTNGAGLNLESGGNVIYANTISQNQIGINMTNSNGNIIYHNNFIGNVIQANILTAVSNTWDDGYPSGGNYWSGYAGQDFKSGPYQNETGSDGIGDTNYTIAINNVDRYPLMWPFNPHDIGIVSVYTEKTVVCQGYNMSISVRILNYGGSNEIPTLTINASAAIIGTQAIALPSRNSTTITFTWNTKGFAKGNYTLSAYATPVPEETDTKDNNFTGGWIIVSMVGDLTGASGVPWPGLPDGKVDGKDLTLIAKCFGSWPGAPPPMTWTSNADINDDGKVDGKDLTALAKHFGEFDP
jgi:parallel beta-helix repeat protein